MLSVQQHRNTGGGLALARRTWLIDSLIPEGAVTILAGDGGSGKSLLALRWAIGLLGQSPRWGRSAMNQSVRSVLYADAELDRAEFETRARAVTKGMALVNVPAGLHYMRLHHPLTRGDTMTALGETAAGRQADLVIMDSLTLALGGVATSKRVNEVMAGLLKLGTVLTIDHVAKQDRSKPFGSVFKYNLARSVIMADGSVGWLRLTQTKSNFGMVASPQHFEVWFSPDRIEWRFADWYE